jgi:8-oxo-dGTP diphosphatase
MAESVEVVAGAIIQDARLLACRRAPHKQHGSLWELPGGKVEPGESHVSALTRELVEELAILVTVGDLVGVSDFSTPEMAIQLHAYFATLAGGHPSVTDSHTEHVWLARHELESVTWAPADIPLVSILEQVQWPQGPIRGE